MSNNYLYEHNIDRVLKSLKVRTAQAKQVVTRRQQWQLKMTDENK